jgi:hypothetical protein
MAFCIIEGSLTTRGKAGGRLFSGGRMRALQTLHTLAQIDISMGSGGRAQ